jgi:hypothetical protein
VVRAAALLCALVGCGSAAKGPDAAAGNGGGGAGGTAGGAGGSAGSAGAGAGGSLGTGTAGAGGDGSGLPACAITARPQAPITGASDGGIGVCNSIVLDGPSIIRGCLERRGDGGVADGGVFDGPTGGAIRDGDYDLVGADGALSSGSCPADYSGGTTRRRMRVFDGGTYIEWAYINTDSAGTDTGLSYDTTVQAAGHTLTFVSFDCSSSFGVTSYGYTAGGDDFTYFAYYDGADGAGDLQTVVRYRRTCRR